MEETVLFREFVYSITSQAHAIACSHSKSLGNKVRSVSPICSHPRTTRKVKSFCLCASHSEMCSDTHGSGHHLHPHVKLALATRTVALASNIVAAKSIVRFLVRRRRQPPMLTQPCMITPPDKKVDATIVKMNSCFLRIEQMRKRATVVHQRELSHCRRATSPLVCER